MKTIPLTKGFSTIVDDQDWNSVSQYKWYASRAQSGRYYAVSYRGTRKRTALHRLLMNVKDGEIVDHADRDTLNNTRSNLRLATWSESNQNKAAQRNGKSGAKGVSYSSRTDLKSRWRAQISKDGKRITLGYFASKELAKSAYDAAALKYFGDFACTNTMLDSKRLINADLSE